MFIDDQTYVRNGKTYRRVLLRNSFRVNCRVRHKTIANLSKCKDEEIAALKLAIKHKSNLQALTIVSEETSIVGSASVQTIPEPHDSGKALLAAAGVSLPDAIPCRNVKAVTRKKLVPQRRSS
jgi:hypothetical protein